MTNAAIYTRISSDRLADGLGVERQEADCRALAAKRGWTVAEVYQDNDLSAYSGKPRPAYKRLLAGIRDGSIDAILAWHNDRLHRSPRELEDFIDLVELRGIAVQMVTAGSYDLTTPTGRLQARIVGNVARFESEHKSERVRRKMDELVKAGQPHAGGRPFGLRRVLGPDGHPGRPVAYEVVPEEAALIAAAADAILDEGRSVRSIAADWRARGVLSPRGNPWRPETLARTLSSAYLAGLRERHVDRDPLLRGARRGVVTLTEAKMPAILPRARWQALRAWLSDPARRTTTGNARVNLLAGLLRCGRPDCGKILVGHPRPGGDRRYVCPTKNLGGCGGTAIMAEPAEAEIVARVLAALDSKAMRDALAATTTNVEVDPLGERAEAENRMVELAGAWAAGSITRPEWQAARTILTERLKALEPATVRPTLRLPADVRAAWPGLDLEERRRILSVVIESITVGPAIRGRNVFDPDRVEIAWRV